MPSHEHNWASCCYTFLAPQTTRFQFVKTAHQCHLKQYLEHGHMTCLMLYELCVSAPSYFF